MCCAQLEVLVGTGEYQSYLVRALCHVNHPLVDLFLENPAPGSWSSVSSHERHQLLTHLLSGLMLFRIVW